MNDLFSPAALASQVLYQPTRGASHGKQGPELPNFLKNPSDYLIGINFCGYIFSRIRHRNGAEIPKIA